MQNLSINIFLRINLFIVLFLLLTSLQGQGDGGINGQKKVILNYKNCSGMTRPQAQWKADFVNVATKEIIHNQKDAFNKYMLDIGTYRLKLLGPYKGFEYSRQFRILEKSRDSIDVCVEVIETEILEKSPHSMATNLLEKDTFYFVFYSSGCSGPARSDTIQLVKIDNVYKGWIRSWKIFGNKKRVLISKELLFSASKFNKFVEIENECKLFRKMSLSSVEMLFFGFGINEVMHPYFNQSGEFTSYLQWRNELILN